MKQNQIDYRMTLASPYSPSADVEIAVEDETSCGPHCTHPSCWESTSRKDKGFPHYTIMTQPLDDEEPTETDLPNQTMYNMLDDYGFDPNDRYPVRYDGHWLYQTSSDKHIHSALERKRLMPTPRRASQNYDKLPQLHVVEVQEVFDIDDLNSRWDETFLSKQCYMWVPNPNKSTRKKPCDSPRLSDEQDQQIVLVKDHTEEMMPLEIERHREETKVFAELPVLKKKVSSHSSNVARPRTHLKSSLYSARDKPRVDADGLRDLLELPRDILMQVLDRLKESDFTSKKKIQTEIENVKQSLESRKAQIKASTANPVFIEHQKVKLQHGKERNHHQPAVIIKPVFQLDDDKSSAEIHVRGIGKDSPRDEDRSSVKDVSKYKSKETKDSESDIETRNALSTFSKYKKPLPDIGNTGYLEGDKVSYQQHNKISSVSLGLPELPSGVTHVRPFTYRNRQFLDLSIGPVPSTPSSSRTSIYEGSDHGTTIRPNITSASTRMERDVRGVVYDPKYIQSKSPKGTKSTRGTLPSRSSVHSPKAPLSPVASKQLREISVSPVPRFQAPANSPNQSPASSPFPDIIADNVIEELEMEIQKLRKNTFVPEKTDNMSEMKPEKEIIEKPSNEESEKEIIKKLSNEESEKEIAKKSSIQAIDRKDSFRELSPPAEIHFKRNSLPDEQFRAYLDLSIFEPEPPTVETEKHKTILNEIESLDKINLEKTYHETERMDVYVDQIEKPKIHIKKDNFITGLYYDVPGTTKETTEPVSSVIVTKPDASVKENSTVEHPVTKHKTKKAKDVHNKPKPKKELQPGDINIACAIVTSATAAATAMIASAEIFGESVSPDTWPQVDEAAYEQASVPSAETNHGSRQEQPVEIPSTRIKPNACNADSGHDSLARKLMDDCKNDQSPAPPPPSPELKSMKKLNAEIVQVKSHDSLVMEPLYEETGEMMEDTKSVQVAGGSSVEDDSGITMHVSHVAPTGNANRRNEMSDQTFVNVDIPADQADINERTNGEGTVKSDAEGTTFRSNIPSSAGVSAAGYNTERTLTGELASDECEDSSPDTRFKETIPASKNQRSMIAHDTLPDMSRHGMIEDSESTTDTERIDVRPMNAAKATAEESDSILGQTDVIRTSADTISDRNEMMNENICERSDPEGCQSKTEVEEESPIEDVKKENDISAEETNEARVNNPEENISDQDV